MPGLSGPELEVGSMLPIVFLTTYMDITATAKTNIAIVLWDMLAIRCDASWKLFRSALA
jgi:hypothetical protein